MDTAVMVYASSVLKFLRRRSASAFERFSYTATCKSSGPSFCRVLLNSLAHCFFSFYLGGFVMLRLWSVCFRKTWPEWARLEGCCQIKHVFSFLDIKRFVHVGAIVVVDSPEISLDETNSKDLIRNHRESRFCLETEKMKKSKEYRVAPANFLFSLGGISQYPRTLSIITHKFERPIHCSILYDHSYQKLFHHF